MTGSPRGGKSRGFLPATRWRAFPSLVGAIFRRLGGSATLFGATATRRPTLPTLFGAPARRRPTLPTLFGRGGARHPGVGSSACGRSTRPLWGLEDKGKPSRTERPRYGPPTAEPPWGGLRVLALATRSRVRTKALSIQVLRSNSSDSRRMHVGRLLQRRGGGACAFTLILLD